MGALNKKGNPQKTGLWVLTCGLQTRVCISTDGISAHSDVFLKQEHTLTRKMHNHLTNQDKVGDL